MGAIVCGVDDSESAKEAARVARVLGAKLGHRIVFARVVETAYPCQKISVLAKRLQHLAKDETEVDCSAGWLVDVGYPADRLVAAAAEEKASFRDVAARTLPGRRCAVRCRRASDGRPSAARGRRTHRGARPHCARNRRALQDQ
jgi:nucleotide-binding universal stress UspA family protein